MPVFILSPILVAHEGGRHGAGRDADSFRFETSSARDGVGRGGSTDVQVKDSASAYQAVKLQDVLVTSYQSGGHSGATHDPDLLSDPVVFDTCGGGDGSMPIPHIAIGDHPF